MFSLFVFTSCNFLFFLLFFLPLMLTKHILTHNTHTHTRHTHTRHDTHTHTTHTHTHTHTQHQPLHPQADRTRRRLHPCVRNGRRGLSHRPTRHSPASRADHRQFTRPPCAHTRAICLCEWNLLECKAGNLGSAAE